MKANIRKFGRSLMGPLSIVVAAGMLLGIVSILQNPSMVGHTVVNSIGIQNFVNGVREIVGMIFTLLPVIFAICVAIGMTKEDKEIASLAAVMAFFIFHIMISYLLQLNNITAENTAVEYLMQQGVDQIEAFKIMSSYETILGIFTYRMGIFGGIIVGLWTAFIHDRYHKQELPIAFSFFAGNRFVPLVILVTMPVIAIAAYYIWPFFNMLINGFGDIIGATGIFAPFLSGSLVQLLIPTGLHHIINQILRFTPIGGSAVIDGQTVSGALNMFNAALASPNADINVLRYSTRFLSQGMHPFMLFGFPAACLAMYRTAYLEQRPKIKGMMIAAALTSFLTGITEPVEFSFIFVSPILYIFSALMSGLSYFLMSIMKVSVGNVAGGVMDLLIFGVLQGLHTRWYLVVLVGLAYAVIYYYVFKFVILKFNVKTPGREDNVTVDEKENSKVLNGDNFGTHILEAIGGKGNVVEIDNCLSRLRLVLNDTSVVNKSLLKATGSMGIVTIDNRTLQIVYGPHKVEQAARSLKDAVKWAEEKVKE